MAYTNVFSSVLSVYGKVEVSADVNGAYIKVTPTDHPAGQEMDHDEMIEFLTRSIAAVEFVKSQYNEEAKG
jgi:formylmethanofuran dehydrogenase subunit C